MDIQTRDGITLRGIPDGTPEEQIKARIEKIRADRGTAAPSPSAMPAQPAQPAAPQMGQLEAGWDAFTHHLGTNVLGPGQLVANIVGGERADSYNEFMRQSEADYQKRVPNNFGAYAGATLGEVLPFLVSAPTAIGRGVATGVGKIASKIPQFIGGAGRLGPTIRAGIAGGAVSAPAIPVVNDGDYWSQKGIQELMGLGVGGAAPAVIRGAGALAQNVGGHVADIGAAIFAGSGGAKRIGRDQIDTALTGADPYELNALWDALNGGGTEFVRGAKPTARQAIAEAQMADGSRQIGGGLMNLERAVGRQPGSIGAELQTGINKQKQAMVAPLQDAAGGPSRFRRESGVNDMVAGRREATKPMFEGAVDRANTAQNSAIETAGTVQKGINDYSGQVAAADARNTNALQQEGQLRTTAAQMEAARNPRPDLGAVESQMPSAGVSRTAPQAGGQYPPQTVVGPSLNPDRGGFIPVPGQPRVSGRYHPNTGIPEEARAAADEFRQIAQQSRGEYDSIRGRLNDLVNSGMQQMPSNSLMSNVARIVTRPGASDTEKALGRKFGERLASVTDENGIVDMRDLATIRTEISRDIRRMMESDPGWDRQKAAGVATTFKGQIDEAIEAAGGAGWRDALNMFRQHSDAIDRKKLTGGLLEKLTDSSGGLTPKSFIDTLERGDRGFMGEHIDGADIGSLMEHLGSDIGGHVNGVERQLLRDAKANEISDLVGGADMASGIKGEIPRIPFNLSPKAAIVNAVTSRLGGGAVEPTASELTRLFQDPKMIANIISGLTAEGGNVGIPLFMKQAGNRASGVAERALTQESMRQQ